MKELQTPALSPSAKLPLFHQISAWAGPWVATGRNRYPVRKAGGGGGGGRGEVSGEGFQLNGGGWEGTPRPICEKKVSELITEIV